MVVSGSYVLFVEDVGVLEKMEGALEGIRVAYLDGGGLSIKNGRDSPEGRCRCAC